MREYTITFDAEITLISNGSTDLEEYFRSEEFKTATAKSLLAENPLIADAHLSNVKVFITREEEA